MLPPHQPPRRKKIETSRPVRAFKAEASEKAQAAKSERRLRVLARPPTLSAVEAMRQRRQPEC